MKKDTTFPSFRRRRIEGKKKDDSFNKLQKEKKKQEFIT